MKLNDLERLSTFLADTNARFCVRRWNGDQEDWYQLAKLKFPDLSRKGFAWALDHYARELQQMARQVAHEAKPPDGGIPSEAAE